MKTNFIHFCLLCLFLLPLSNHLLAQSFTDQLGGINTTFLITSGEDQISKEQVLIKRAESRIGIETVCDGGAGFGSGYQSYHLEFFAEQKINVVNAYDPTVKLKEFYVVKCFDKGNGLLAQFEIDKQDLNFTSNYPSSDAAIYSLDMKDIPFIQLNHTAKINIEYVRLSRKHHGGKR